ncbi:basic salivary proline-rich protein 4-like [Falco naumanni]|uniref:basic salivary proline-rich protein 4-like n=1 Tax=Falco naumanni TaxID=148594 RepID=UPI001ADDF7EB|nr:basic salivary proline-rich protein 4-like [Falco naumanni]
MCKLRPARTAGGGLHCGAEGPRTLSPGGPGGTRRPPQSAGRNPSPSHRAGTPAPLRPTQGTRRATRSPTGTVGSPRRFGKPHPISGPRRGDAPRPKAPTGARPAPCSVRRPLESAATAGAAAEARPRPPVSQAPPSAGLRLGATRRHIAPGRTVFSPGTGSRPPRQPLRWARLPPRPPLGGRLPRGLPLLRACPPFRSPPGGSKEDLAVPHGPGRLLGPTRKKVPRLPAAPGQAAARAANSCPQSPSALPAASSLSHRDPRTQRSRCMDGAQ